MSAKIPAEGDRFQAVVGDDEHVEIVVMVRIDERRDGFIVRRPGENRQFFVGYEQWLQKGTP